MKQIGIARLYDATGHFVCKRYIYEDEQGQLVIIQKNPHLQFKTIPNTFKIEFTLRF